MGVAKGIRKLGFRTWHERELLLGFGWMAVLLLCAIFAFAALETLIGSSSWGTNARSAVIIVASGACGIVAMHRFLMSLAQVQSAASQAICRQCETFGRLRVIADDAAGTWVRVSCRGCAYEWVMDLSLSERKSHHPAGAEVGDQDAGSRDPCSGPTVRPEGQARSK
jgi:hypothetical protein